MTRWKPWVVVAVALAVGGAGLTVGSERLAARQLAQVDRTLAAARAQVELSQAVLARQVEAVSLLAARDPDLLSALAEPPPAPPRGRRAAPKAAPPPRPDPGPVAEAAVKAAARAMGVDLSRGMLSTLAGEAGARKDPAQGLLLAAAAGSARHGYVRYGDTVYYGSAAPVRKGTALLFGLPIDSQWTEALEAATSVRVVLFSGPGKPNASLPPGEAEAFAAAAARPGGAPAGLGRLGKVKPPSPGFLPAMPLLLVKAPAQRVLGLPLAGLPGAALVLAAPTLPALSPLGAAQQLSLLGMAVLLLVAAVLTVLPEGGPARWPRELLAVADRIARGDFEARAPRLAGSAGAVGAALNRAAEAAAAAREAPEPSAPPPPELPESPLPAPPPAPAEAEDTARDFPTGLGGRASAVAAVAPPPPGPPPGGPIAAAATTGRLDASELFGAAPSAPAPGLGGTTRFGAPPPPAKAAAPPPAAVPRPTAPPAVAPVPPPAAAPAAAAFPAGASPMTPESEEEHWQQVFQDFLRVREQCREPSEGLTYERFRQKLQKNKESLVLKYSCRAVRFQVYVKEGKTALKATPVR